LALESAGSSANLFDFRMGQLSPFLAVKFLQCSENYPLDVAGWWWNSS